MFQSQRCEGGRLRLVAFDALFHTVKVFQSQRCEGGRLRMRVENRGFDTIGFNRNAARAAA